MLRIDDYFCPICGYGERGFYLCADAVTVVILCHECYAIWLDPEHTALECSLRASPPDFVVPGLQCSLKSPLAR